jgi:hypothetical protein
MDHAVVCCAYYQWQYLFVREKTKTRKIGTNGNSNVVCTHMPRAPLPSPLAPLPLSSRPPDLCCFALQVYSPLLLIAAVEPLRRHFLSDSVPCKVRGVVHELVGGGMTDTDARTCVEFMCNSILKVRTFTYHICKLFSVSEICSLFNTAET